ncbi:hypothetical protein F441_04388 [Phytophthora nicotianae CJ01A1]|uniref:Uncharacterized protein n=1 Tax=Phytophthora nicotianae CJ01A1 TaxID=1317063 RepID=W2XI15_PHYNI|nr:hypothetical protein F441_04388 [Phytophthora nicotianae CJ01A1]
MPAKKQTKAPSDESAASAATSPGGLRDFIKHNDVTQKEVRDSICIQGRFLWSAPETNGNYHFLRLYLSEQQAPEPLRQQQQEFQAAQREDAFKTNQYLITVSLYEVASNDPNLPVPGAVISFSPTKASIYRNCCQVNAKLAGISTINVP